MVAGQWLAVGGGAAIGAWMRWGFGIAFNVNVFPFGTLITNLVGGFLVGMAMAYFAAMPNENELRLLVTTGFLGGLTTFSAFSAEAFHYLHKQEYAWAAGHITSHVGGSLVMTAIGFSLMQYWRQ